jgi:hypothetical protein
LLALQAHFIVVKGVCDSLWPVALLAPSAPSAQIKEQTSLPPKTSS